MYLLSIGYMKLITIIVGKARERKRDVCLLVGVGGGPKRNEPWKGWQGGAHSAHRIVILRPSIHEPLPEASFRRSLEPRTSYLTMSRALPSLASVLAPLLPRLSVTEVLWSWPLPPWQWFQDSWESEPLPCMSSSVATTWCLFVDSIPWINVCWLFKWNWPWSSQLFLRGPNQRTGYGMIRLESLWTVLCYFLNFPVSCAYACGPAYELSL